MNSSNQRDPSLDWSRRPLLLVVGMHRSGTSAITGSLGVLGFHTPHVRDRMGFSSASNAEHWESLSLSVYNDHLLAKLGGSWDAPPDLPLRWEHGDPEPELDSALLVLNRAYPLLGPSVWKDPRLCLLLPLWKRILPSPLAAILIWRSPLAVARSLQKRDGFHLADGLALWERYNRSALRNLAGIDTYICNYETVLRDPAGALNRIADWLSTLPQLSDRTGQWRREQSAASIVRSNTGTEGDSAGSELLLPQHRELVLTLSSLTGGHQPLRMSSNGSESDWTTALLAARNNSRTYGLLVELDDTQRAIDRMRGSTSWRATKPLRAIASALHSIRSRQ